MSDFEVNLVVLNYLLCDPQPMFVASTRVTERHTAQVLSGQIHLVEKMHEIGNERISALVTDNAANMRVKKWRVLFQR